MKFTNKQGIIIVDKMILAIKENRDYLSEIDGAIGDGDHGINMSKGFMIAEKELKDQDLNMSQGLEQLGKVLMSKIGGSMGPLYGTFFCKMAEASKQYEEIDAQVFQEMLTNAYTGITDISPAKPGDKTLIDVLYPALDTYKKEITNKAGFLESLKVMAEAAEAGLESTKDMIAKLGRASRLGERSRGYQDAGATSCFILLNTMAETIKKMAE